MLYLHVIGLLFPVVKTTPVFKNWAYVYVGIFVPLSVIIPLVPSVFKYQHLTVDLRILSGYLLLSGISNLLTSVLAFHNIRNMPVMHIYTLAEFIILGIFYKNVDGTRKLDKYINWFIGAFAVFCIVNAFCLQSLFVFNTYTRSAEAIVIISLGVYYFVSTLDNVSYQEARIRPVAYANSGLLLYFSGSFIFFVVQNVSLPTKELRQLIWILHGTLLVIMYQLFALALWKHRR